MFVVCWDHHSNSCAFHITTQKWWCQMLGPHESWSTHTKVTTEWCFYQLAGRPVPVYPVMANMFKMMPARKFPKPTPAFLAQDSLKMLPHTALFHQQSFFAFDGGVYVVSIIGRSDRISAMIHHDPPWSTMPAHHVEPHDIRPLGALWDQLPSNILEPSVCLSNVTQTKQLEAACKIGYWALVVSTRLLWIDRFRPPIDAFKPWSE